jgi:hypothetical protein
MVLRLRFTAKVKVEAKVKVKEKKGWRLEDRN